jgi:hypothetical protein
MCLKFRFKIMEAYSQTTIYEWFRRLQNRRTSRDEDERSSRLSTSSSENLIAHMKNIIRGNRRLAVWEVAEAAGHWFMPLNLNGRFRNTSGPRRICAKTLH